MMEEYIEQYGRHFNKALFEFAVGMMKDRSGRPLKVWDKDQVAAFLKGFGVQLRSSVGHDAAYVLHMARADYFGSSLPDDNRLATFVKDYLEDPDGYDTKPFDHFFMDCMAMGIPIFWDEML